jgi:hypothetical protein
MTASATPRRQTARRVALASVPIAGLVAVLLLVRGCHNPEPEPERLFVPRDLAGLRKLDRAGVLAYCRHEVRPADYPGVLRGAHGALWAGEANPWDRALLAAAALEGAGAEARVVPADPPRVCYRDGDRWATARLDADDPPEVSAAPPADAAPAGELPDKRPDLFHLIQPAVVLERDGGPAERVQPPQPERVAEWAYQPVLLEARPADGGVAYALRVGPREVLCTPVLSGVRRATLELTWTFGNQSETWSRELFDAENARPEIPGHDAPRAGDRYAIVLAAGPLAPEALATRARMMELPGYTPEADETARRLVTAAAKYQVDCDDRTRALAAECEVRVTWPKPRITVAASEVPAKAEPAAGVSPGLSLDALADAVEADGPKARDFQVARSLAADLVETRVVYEAARRPAVSASTVFSNFKSDAPDAPARRVGLIRAEAERVLKAEPVGSAVAFASTLPPYLTDDEKTRAEPGLGNLRMERTAGGLVVHGLAKTAGDRPQGPWQGYEWRPDGAVPFADPGGLAVVVDGMLARRIGRTDYGLACEAHSAWPLGDLPVVGGSLLTYKARVGGKDFRLAVLVKLQDGKPAGAWFDAATGRGGEVAGGWPDVLAAAGGGPQLRGYLADALPAGGEPAQVKVRVGANERAVGGRRVAVPGGSAVLLPEPNFPLVLEWQRGDLSLALESASPVVRGRARDADTGQPVRATVAVTRKTRVTELPPPANLKTWKQDGPPNNGRWQAGPDGTTVTQRADRDPSFFVGPGDVIDTTVRFRVREDGRSGGSVGFVAGYRPTPGGKESDREFLLFDWRRTAEGGGQEGFCLARVTGPPDTAVKAGFADHKDQERFRVLATAYGPGKGWKNKEENEVEVRYHRDRVRVAINGEAVFDVAGTFEPGRFGVYTSRAAPVTFQEVRFGPAVSRLVGHDADAHDAAADGTFAQPVLTRPQRLLLVVDRSGSMVFTLDPKFFIGPRKAPPPVEQQRITFLRREVHRLLDRLPPTVEVGLWSFTTGPVDRDNDNPRHTREECPYTTDHARVKAAIDRLKPEGGTPLTGTVKKIVAHVKDDPLSRDAAVVLLTDGENSDTSTTLAAVYRKEGGAAPIHTIGFAIEPRGKAERDLRELAQVSGGTFRVAGSGEDLRLAFDRVSDQFPAVDLTLSTTCHAPAEVRVPGAELGLRPLDVRLSHGCATCRCSGKTLLTVTRETAAKLAECDGLSPKARRMIEDRLRGGGWVVTIPTRRVNVGRVSAYAWWETERATGRMVGRTEDGLHGSTDDEDNWPGLAPPSGLGEAGKPPFVAWYHGIVSYTTGSVLAAMAWHRSPGFLAGGPEEFVRFVQANALGFAARWWGEVGSSAFPENLNAYWAGVCLNFTLQSLATRMPSLACHREWAGALCDQAAGAVSDLPTDAAKEHGADYQKLHDSVQKYQELLTKTGVESDPNGPLHKDAQQFLDALDGLKKSWEDGVAQGFDCARLRGKSPGP